MRTRGRDEVLTLFAPGSAQLDRAVTTSAATTTIPLASGKSMNPKYPTGIACQSRTNALSFCGEGFFVELPVERQVAIVDLQHQEPQRSGVEPAAGVFPD